MTMDRVRVHSTWKVMAAAPPAAKAMRTIQRPRVLSCTGSTSPWSSAASSAGSSMGSSMASSSVASSPRASAASGVTPVAASPVDRRANHHTDAPTTTAASTRSARAAVVFTHEMPRVGRSTRPAAAVPLHAPRRFAEYRNPVRLALRRCTASRSFSVRSSGPSPSGSGSATKRVSSGSVAPMRVVGMIRVTNTSRKRTRLKT